MSYPPPEERPPADLGSHRQGLLDLSIELSSPEVVSGTRFALYLHVKNPFSRPIWIRKVTTHLPTAVQALETKRPPKNAHADQPSSSTLETYTQTVLGRLAGIQKRLAQLDDNPGSDEAKDLTLQARELSEQLRRVHEASLDAAASDQVSVSAGASAWISSNTRPLQVSAHGEHSAVRIEGIRQQDETVALHGALPPDIALQPGGHNVWTLTLGTRKNPFFLPAAYRFNVTVLYSFDPPDSGHGDVLHSNTAPTTINIRSSLWSVMAGSITGGLLGAAARILQQAKSMEEISALTAAPPLMLAVVLSIAAAIFAARKSETQSFVSVEDFWGGALVGFLIGYSGTAAFESITHIQD